MKRVFMLSRQPLYSQGVENLLRREPGLEIVGRESDTARAIERIRELRPDVVFLDSKDLASSPSTVVAQILKEVPTIQVLVLNLENQAVQIYKSEERTAENLEDLLQVIDEEAFGPGPISAEEWHGLAAGRTRIYGLLARIYSRPPDAELVQHLLAGSMALATCLERGEDVTGDLREGLRRLERYRHQISSCPPSEIERELTGEYHRLVREEKNGDASGFACESHHVDGDGEGQIPVHADVMREYAAGDFAFRNFDAERPDSIGCELAFMEHLCSRELSAWEKNARAEACEIQAREQAFLRDHLARWVPRFCDVLLARSRLDFSRAIAFLTRGFVLNEAYRVAELIEWTHPAAE